MRDTACEHGQTGWMSWAIAICIDLTCAANANATRRPTGPGAARSPGPSSS
ncbi:hypothetical protein [Nonomuraea sp. NPDC049709]|uniref:hypothetical protein n=1 Tax=Nonomuraea sp. NPDC049709 TaxID=3154736 RepID=UPI00343F64C5